MHEKCVAIMKLPITSCPQLWPSKSCEHDLDMWDSHTVHMFTQWHLPPPPTSTAKSPLFTRVHSRPLSLAARLHRCCANHSRYINNGWTFSWTDLVHVTTWMNLKSIVLNKRRQSQKMTLFTWCCGKGCWFPGVWVGMWVWLQITPRGHFAVLALFCILIVLVVTQIHVKTHKTVNRKKWIS